MIDINKITKKIYELEKSEKDEKKNEQNQAQTDQVEKTSEKVMEVESKPKTVVYETKPNVVVTMPQKPQIQTPTYERVEYVPKTDEEIEQDVTEELSAYKQNAINGIDSDYENVKSQKEQEKTVQSEKLAGGEKTVNEAYEEADKAITSDLIKRGMYDSSTNALMREKNAEDRDSALKKLSEKHASAIALIDSDIAKAEAQRQKAINDFNVTYALKYAERISKLKQQREDEIEKALKYNNEITEQEYKDVIEKEKTESKLYSEALSQKQQEMVIESKQKYEEVNSYEYRIYTILRNQLAGMSKADAYKAIHNDPTYADNLTTTYYLQLVDEFGRGQPVPDVRDNYGENLYER